MSCSSILPVGIVPSTQDGQRPLNVNIGSSLPHVEHKIETRCEAVHGAPIRPLNTSSVACRCSAAPLPVARNRG
jgi:hypothetical protein